MNLRHVGICPTCVPSYRGICPTAMASLLGRQVSAPPDDPVFVVEPIRELAELAQQAERLAGRAREISDRLTN